MRHALARIDSAERTADSILDDEVFERDDDLGGQERGQDDAPSAAPREPGECPEDDRIDEVSRRVQPQLVARRRAPGGESRAPLVIVERVESAKRPLKREQPKGSGHAPLPSTSMQPP